MSDLENSAAETYSMLGKAKDATFELMDSVMTTRNASCLGEFSRSPLFRRKWPSTYETLQDSRPNGLNIGFAPYGAAYL